MTQKNFLIIQKWMLFLTILLLPVTSFPARFTLPLIGNTMSLYPAILGLMIFAVEMIWYPVIHKKIFLYFLGVYVLWSVVCNFRGIAFYPYYNLLTLDQFHTFPKICMWLGISDFQVNSGWMIKVLLFFKLINFKAMLAFTVSYWIFHLYRSDWSEGFRDIRRGFGVLAVLMGLYSIPEIGWLRFSNPICADILMWINPHLYDPASVNEWWPPLLLTGQLRSICAEPSFFGILSATMIPFLWSYLFDKNKAKYCFLYFYFAMMLFLTKARTGLIAFNAELGLLILGNLIGSRKFLKSVFGIILLTGIAFTVQIVDYNDLLSGNGIRIQQYISDNITSAFHVKERSNESRYISLVANLNVIGSHPLMGVGNGLKDVYIDKNLPEGAQDDAEVSRWSRDMHEKGPFVSGYPPLNELADVAASSGIIGLLLYLLPVAYLLRRIWRKRNFIFQHPKILCLVIALVGNLAVMFSNDAFLSYYIVIGLLLCITDGENEKKQR